MIGAAVRLAREDDPTELESELRTLDAFVETNCFDRSD